MTPQEVKLWAHLRRLRGDHGWKFRRQVPLRGYIVDFACFGARLIIEVDGSQHGFEENRARDRKRDETLERNGFAILRFWNAEIDHEFDGVWRTIKDALLNAEARALGAGPSSPLMGEVAASAAHGRSGWRHCVEGWLRDSSVGISAATHSVIALRALTARPSRASRAMTHEAVLDAYGRVLHV